MYKLTAKTKKYLDRILEAANGADLRVRHISRWSEIDFNVVGPTCRGTVWFPSQYVSFLDYTVLSSPKTLTEGQIEERLTAIRAYLTAQK